MNPDSTQPLVYIRYPEFLEILSVDIGGAAVLHSDGA